ncbi:hypothetical protein ACT691_07485 [Vibrio metschnikovii]
MIAHLRSEPTYGDLLPSIVVKVEEKSAQVWVKNAGLKTIAWEDMNWARRFITDDRQGPLPTKASDILAVGEQVWIRRQHAIGDEQEHWTLSQVPNANTAFVAMDPDNGAILALVGGFNFVHSNFNRATQSVRQGGVKVSSRSFTLRLWKKASL